MDKQNDNRESAPPPAPLQRKPELVPAKFAPKGILIWLAVFALMLMGYQYYLRDQEAIQILTYNPEFVQLVETKAVTACEVVEEISGNQFIVGTLKTLDPRSGQPLSLIHI